MQGLQPDKFVRWEIEQCFNEITCRWTFQLLPFSVRILGWRISLLIKMSPSPNDSGAFGKRSTQVKSYESIHFVAASVFLMQTLLHVDLLGIHRICHVNRPTYSMRSLKTIKNVNTLYTIFTLKNSEYLQRTLHCFRQSTEHTKSVTA